MLYGLTMGETSTTPLCGCGTELSDAGSSSFVLFLEYISYIFFPKWSWCLLLL